ncbi:hypothetical protein PRVXT_000528 [Proteinivorax tanatarense]|uniref:Transposase InsH N-terminal domain-containing protein n=1 Tax=Proteinivorax tanatarense TaxID=1260629 RepID=A0AAU7VN83_9FIRM
MQSIIPDKYHSDKTLIKNVDNFFKKYQISSLLNRYNFNKSKGIPCTSVIKYIFIMVFSGKNLYRTSSLKTTFCRFLKMLFIFRCYDDLEDIKFATAFNLIITMLSKILKEQLYVAEEAIEKVMSNIIKLLPLYVRDRKVFFSCES